MGNGHHIFVFQGEHGVSLPQGRLTQALAATFGTVEHLQSQERRGTGAIGFGAYVPLHREHCAV